MITNRIGVTDLPENGIIGLHIWGTYKIACWHKIADFWECGVSVWEGISSARCTVDTVNACYFLRSCFTRDCTLLFLYHWIDEFSNLWSALNFANQPKLPSNSLFSHLLCVFCASRRTIWVDNGTFFFPFFGTHLYRSSSIGGYDETLWSTEFSNDALYFTLIFEIVDLATLYIWAKSADNWPRFIRSIMSLLSSSLRWVGFLRLAISRDTKTLDVNSKFSRAFGFEILPLFNSQSSLCTMHITVNNIRC